MADYQYISCLSTDAAPVIARYVEEHPEVKTEDERIWRLNWYYNYLEQNRHAMDDINLRNFNVSHYLAREVLKDE